MGAGDSASADPDAVTMQADASSEGSRSAPTDPLAVTDFAGRAPGGGELVRGDLVGRYVVLSRIGQGGMGVVYAAYDPELDRKIALKLLLSRGEDSVSARARLLREAQALAQLAHPNVVAVFDVGTLGARVWIAMEFVAGATLSEWLSQGRRRWREVLQIFLAAAEGLQAAHAAGLVHRDFKPDNVMVSGDGRVRVMDFGLARAEAGAAEGGGADEAGCRGAATATLTRIGALVGTPRYMAPEQWNQSPVDARTDQFSFCVALWEAMYGEPPFAAASIGELAIAVTEGRLRSPPAGLRPPGWLRAALMRGLAVDRARRFASMGALIEALRDAPASRRRRWIAAGLLGLLGLAAGIGVSAYRELQGGCTERAQWVASLWAERRDAVHARMLEADVPYAQDSWDRLDAVMQGRAAAWAELLRATCEAYPRTFGEAQRQLDARTTCLYHQAGAVEAMLAALVDDPASAARHALKVESQLDPVGACAAVTGLPGWSRPGDVREALRAEALRRSMMEVRAAGELGRYRPALARAEAILEAAREAGDPGLVAEAMVRIGVLQRALVANDRAAATLEEAYWLALGAGSDETAIEAASWLVIVHGFYRRDRERGRLWERSAAALLQRVPGRPRLAAAYHNNRAIVRVDEGRLDEAVEDYQRALEIYESEGDDDSPKVALVLGNMSRVHYVRGELDMAMSRIERALRIRERRLGVEHPEVAITLSNMGIVLTDLGDLDGAEASLRRALAIEEAVYGPRHVKLTAPLDNLARALARRGRWDEATQASRRALELLAASERPDPGAVADVRLGLGTVFALQGRFDEALPELRQAVTLREQASGPAHPDAVQARVELAEALLLAGDAAAAEELVAGAPGQATPVQIAAMRALRGRALVARGLSAQAEPLLREVLPSLPAPLARGRARGALAMARLADDRGEALELALQAEADLQTAGAGFERECAALAGWRKASGSQ